MRSAQLMHEVKRVEPVRHRVNHFLQRLPFPALLVICDSIPHPCQALSSDLDQLPEIIHSPCRPQLLNPLIAETQQTIPVPLRICGTQIQIIDHLRIDLHIAVCIKHLTADIRQNFLAPGSQTLRMTAPLILQYHIELLHGQTELPDRHMVNIGDRQLHRLLVEPCYRGRNFMTFLHDLRPHYHAKLLLQIVFAAFLLVDSQLLLRRGEVRFLDRVHDALFPLPHEIILIKEKVFISVAAHAKPCQDAVAQLFSRKTFTPLDLSYHAEGTDIPAQGFQCNPLYLPRLSDQCRKIPQIKRLQLIIFLTFLHSPNSLLPQLFYLLYNPVPGRTKTPV